MQTVPRGLLGLRRSSQDLCILSIQGCSTPTFAPPTAVPYITPPVCWQVTSPCSQDLEKTVLQDSYWPSLSPFRARCFLAESTRRGLPLLPKAALLAAAATDVPGRAGRPRFCGSQEPEQPGNSGLTLSPGMVPSLADPSGPGHHDRCWEHMPGINSPRHSHKRASRFLRLLPPPLLLDFYLAKREICLFLPPLLLTPLRWALSSLF